MVTLNSKITYFLEDTGVINEISCNNPSYFLINKIPTSFKNNFDQISMKISFESAEFEAEPKFDKIINSIKYSHLESIASAVTDLSDITLFDKILHPLCINNRFLAEKIYA